MARTKTNSKTGGFIWKKYHWGFSYYRGLIDAGFTWTRSAYNCDGIIVN